jgi:hypothetical protein
MERITVVIEEKDLLTALDMSKLSGYQPSQHCVSAQAYRRQVDGFINCGWTRVNAHRANYIVEPAKAEKVEALVRTFDNYTSRDILTEEEARENISAMLPLVFDLVLFDLVQVED